MTTIPAQTHCSIKTLVTLMMCSCSDKHSMYKRSSHLLCVSVLYILLPLILPGLWTCLAAEDVNNNDKVAQINSVIDIKHLITNVFQQGMVYENRNIITKIPTTPAITTSSNTANNTCSYQVNCSETVQTGLMPSAVAPLQRRLLSRPKRYLSFPEGSSFSVAICFTVGIIGNPRFNYMSFGLNWGVAYDLPNTTWILNHLHGFAKRPIPVATWHRRSRRFLYGDIERAVDNMGYNGRDCVLRALCESRQYFQNTKMGMIGEMLRVVFSLPKQRLYKRELDENPDIALYDKVYRQARSLDMDCSSQYDCNFSLLELAFGKYSTPPTEYYAEH